MTNSAATPQNIPANPPANPSGNPASAASSAPTFEQYLQSFQGKAIDFRLRVEHGNGANLQFYIHPDGFNGNTETFSVSGNTLSQIS